MHHTTALLPCGVMVLNPESIILSLNPYACQLLGYQEDQLIGKRVDSLLTMASRIYFQTHLYPLITLRNAASELYLNLQTSDRVAVPVLVNVVKQEQAGQMNTYFSFMPVHQRRQYEEDLLAAKKAAEDELLRNEKLVQVQQELEQHQAELDRKMNQLAQRNEELEQFSKIISHDLQEPLRKIMVFTDLLQNGGVDNQLATQTLALAGIGKASSRLRQLVRDLQLYFSQTNLLPTTSSVDLNVVIQQISQEYEGAGVVIMLKKLPVVIGNEAELTSLFRNLIDNAVKFRQPDQQAAIQVSGMVVSQNSFRTTLAKYRYVDYSQITITDNGIGFDNRHSEDVFQIMKRLHPNVPGIGMGLAIAKKIVERHHGRITAKSAVGKGATITVLLPL